MAALSPEQQAEVNRQIQALLMASQQLSRSPAHTDLAKQARRGCELRHRGSVLSKEPNMCWAAQSSTGVLRCR